MEPARHLVWIDEPERLRALAQEAVDEGGLPGPVRPGEEDEGGHKGSFAEIGCVSPSPRIYG